ncbi:MAG TPA: hypothetical protein VGC38_05465 [Pseudolabrys sp.]
MTARKIQIAPELIAEGRRLYEHTLTPVRVIAATMGVCRDTLNNRINEWGWKHRAYVDPSADTAPVAPGAAAVTAPPQQLLSATDAEPDSEPQAPLAVSVRNAVGHVMAAVERVSKVITPRDQGEAERCARTLASVASSLREVATLYKPEEAMPSDEPDDDPIPTDVDEFRRELGRRIHALIDARRDRRGGGAGDAAYGDEATQG